MPSKSIIKEKWDNVELFYSFEDEIQDETIDKSAEWQTIKVFPEKKLFLDRYDETFNFNKELFDDMVENFNNPEIPVLIMDKEHEYKENHADFKNMRYEPEHVNGPGLYIDVKLNEKGVKLVKPGVYKYHSPAWGKYVSVSGKKYENVLKAISLVNFPGLGAENPKLLDQLELKNVQRDKKNIGGSKNMSLELINVELGLKADANSESSVIVVRELKAEIEETKKELKKEKEDNQKAQKMLTELSSKIQAVEQKERQLKAEKVIDEAIEKGKLYPSLRELKIEAYLKDSEIVEKELSLLPEKDLSQASVSKPEQDVNMTEEQIREMKENELDPKSKEDRDIYFATKEV
jgi:hypothetical protein